MPLYEYQCDSHGTFEAFAPLEASREPSPCPCCQEPARKMISSPRLTKMARSTMNAHERNERSREEPHVCKSGCSHNHRSTPSSEQFAAKKKRQEQGKKKALQSYQGARPWVIEHA